MPQCIEIQGHEINEGIYRKLQEQLFFIDRTTERLSILIASSAVQFWKTGKTEDQKIN